LAWSIRSDGHIEFLNQNFLNYLGLAFEQVQKAGWTFPIHAEDVKGFVHAREAILASESVGEVEARIRRFDGQFRWFLCRAVALRDSAGKVVKWFGINFDVEDRKRAEEELRDTQSKLAHMTRLMTIGQLTASIAHEVNQPLAGIITNANTCLRMLAAQPPNIEGARETARRTIRDGNRASEVIKRLRALFSKKDPALEPVDLNEATREVIALSLSKLQANRVILRTELADDLPNVSGDRVQLQQVILNLIQNGSDAMSSVDDRPRDMLVKTERDGHEALCLTVRDVGVGISEEDGGRLFDAFYTTKGDGMGVGLSVSRSIIERHGGRMWTAGNEGPGVSFSFSVPLLPEQKTDAETAVRAGAQRSTERQSK
jgi:PAS domain S-box-containing protein